LAEDKLKESQSNLEEAQHIAQIGSWQLDLKTNTVKWSKEMFHVYDIDPETFDGNPDAIIDVLHPDDVELFKNSINNLKIRDSGSIDYRIIHKDGSIHYLHGVSKVVIDKKGKPIRSIGTVQDITDRKLAEQELKASEEKYKTMLNASPDGIMIIDLKGIIAEVSGIGLELLGVENGDELIGKHFFRFVPTEEKIIIQEAIKKTLNEGIVQNIELIIRKKNQSLFLSEISLTLIQNPDEALNSFMITIRDISQRKKIEKKQIHADRMVNLGEMASGIAHEINQPLNTLSLVIDNILYEATKKENIGKEYLKKKSKKIFTNITRIKNIIDHIRAFSRTNEDYILIGFDINLSINNAVTMISKQFEHLDISLDLQLEGNTTLIIGNTFQFEQVIINMLSNAKDALLEKKKIRKAPFDMLVGIRSFKENQCLIIEITDNGIGISEEDIESIILPFYTTKDTGKGTGLGLSISYQIIREMNGSIEISSDKHTGTTFKIILMIQNKE
jgi:PAS domain S-box-containing protein